MVTTVPFNVNDAKRRRDFLGNILPGIVDNLDVDSKPLWGKMTTQHIVQHLIWAFRLSTGKFKVVCKTPTQLLERARRFLYDDRATPHDFKSPLIGEDPLPFEYPNFSEAKAAFRQESYTKIYKRK